MSNAEVPEQFNSTITFSPFATRTATVPSNNNINNGNNARRVSQFTDVTSPYQSLVANSPLIQKNSMGTDPNKGKNNNGNTNYLNTPYHHFSNQSSHNGNTNNGNGNSNGSARVLESNRKTSFFNSNVPSTLRKVSLQRELNSNSNSNVRSRSTTKYEIDRFSNTKNDMNANEPDNAKLSSTQKNIGEDIGMNEDRNINNNNDTNELEIIGKRKITEIDIASLNSIEKLRLWRHDSLMQHNYRTAEFVGNIIYNITNDPNDAFWLAQVHFATSSYSRVVELLSNNNLDSTSLICKYLTALSLIKLQKFDNALDIIGEVNPFASAEIESESDDDTNIDKNNKINNSSKYNKNSNHTNSTNNNTNINSKYNDGGIKLESSLCYLRGKIFLAQNSFNKAKNSFKEAILVDIKNFEAFEELTSKSLLSPNEEIELIQDLDFSLLDENNDMIKNLYILRLSTNNSLTQNQLNIIKNSQNILIENYYNFENDKNLINSKIQSFYQTFKFNECLELCELFLLKDEFNLDVLPTYIACLYELHCKNKLFQLSHKLAENIPKNSITWFAVGTYYLSVNKIIEARKYFSKSSIIDPTFAPAWLAFSHTFSMEGEHDQAISAYSTASRFFMGTHLPNLYLGMQYMLLNTLSLAEEYFILAYDVSPNDPLLLNEMGVLFYRRNDYTKSKRYLKKALEFIKDLEPSSKIVISIQTNLSNTFRKLDEYDMAIRCLKNILEVSGKDANIYCLLGFLYLKVKKLPKAIEYLHQSLSLKPINSIAENILKHALELNVLKTLDSDHPLITNSSIQSNNNFLNRLNDISKVSMSNMDVTNKKRITPSITTTDTIKKHKTESLLYHKDHDEMELE
ncbi:hypothetical protein TPHA_0N01870 [Tetrapisispora phaffii CBS 4417]|uniref:Uncharacterized protein n=1 Tax=Tetrapisispora phaffii (strain ATCC 24235 / CBS 4417 / NBRC 1672 / NRRL Y-8282 / UCD 70-5) TaxID=1071381 RepID=G8C1E0_TETPH|nr:hypothetical protein TPHA_0N01870 [Tetrapisispora phaffii CBS 4417]CCE65968.1 hypothetical protein TPHA_0N01870 [Tetrapisispora phaffii CBS 4417]